MKACLLVTAGWVAVGAAVVSTAGDAAKLVDAKTVVRGLEVELKYATTDNFLHEAVYPADTACLLRPATAAKLARAQERLRVQGYGLKVWDCFRPLSAQQLFWAKVPDPRFVADPAKGGSRHGLGVSVDVTLVDGEGRELPMPTRFDDFSKRAARDWDGASAEGTRNRDLLRQTLEAVGFRGIRTEWWHFDDEERQAEP